jgi:hypothetical protein
VAETDAAVEQYTKGALALELYKLSGLEKQVAQLGELSLAGLNEEYEQGRMPARYYQYLLPLARDAYRTDKIRRDLLERIEENLDAVCIKAVLSWLRSPLGRKITMFEEAASTSEGVEQMQAFAAQIQTRPISEERFNLVQRLDKATNSTELLIDMVTITVHGVMKELNTILPHAQRVDHHELDQQMSAQRQQTRKNFQYLCMVTSLYTYQSLPDDELERYVAFAESDVGRRYHQTIFREFKKIQSEAALHVGRSLGNAFRDLG